MLIANTVGINSELRLREHSVSLTLLFNDYTFLQDYSLY
jgi:hypothetical protein